MVLKEQELLQIDEKFIQNLLKKDLDALASLSIRLTNDLKEAVERLNQNSNNSSTSGSLAAPWDNRSSSSTDDHEIEADLTPPEEGSKENTDRDKTQ